MNLIQVECVTSSFTPNNFYVMSNNEATHWLIKVFEDGSMLELGYNGDIGGYSENIKNIDTNSGTYEVRYRDTPDYEEQGDGVEDIDLLYIKQHGYTLYRVVRNKFYLDI